MTSPEESVIEALRSHGVPYEIIDIDPDYADTMAFCEKYGYALDRSANTIIVASRREPIRYCACVVLATTRLDVNKKVKKLMGVSRCSFATAEQMMELTGMKVGGVTPFGLPEHVPLYVDSRVMEVDHVLLGGGGRSTKIKTSPEIFVRLGAEVIESLGKELESR